jgi:DNA repair exonuclease SbcCD ATPase subunit|tara:strand:- start:1553 stop:3346 length:1794 start_codon:yes stop_codon:yes gene_type:complete
MITLKQLQWNNCFSYGSDNELLLDENTVTQIIGTNGTGKSSIPLIIEEALYNKNSKGIKKADIPNRYQGDGYNIKLTFTKDTDSYTVSIDRKTTVKVKLEKNGEDISSHTATNTYKTIQEIIGVDFKTFSQLVYQSTNASLQFLTATDTNRKKFLIDLLHLEGYVELFDVFKEESRKLTVEISGAQAAVDTVQKWLSDNKLSDSTILPMLDLRINTEEEEKEFRHLTKEIENILERNKKISKNNQLIELLGQIDLQDIQNPSVTERKSYDALQEEVGNFTQIAAGSKRLLTKLNQLGDTCPTCEQSVDSEFVEELKKEETDKISVSEREIGKIETEIKSIKRDNNEFTRLQTLEADWKEIYRSVDRNLPTSLLDKNELESRLESVRTELLQRKEQLESTAKENEKRTKHNTRIQVIQEQTDSFLKQSEELQEVLEKQQGLASNLDVLKKAFSTNGLLAYKIENLVKELEEMANTYLAELSDGRFTLEFVVSNDKLNVQVTDDGKIVDILALSSGELARVNTATLIAIRKLMSSISKSKLNILFLDEVIAVLDDTGREKLVEVLIEEDLNTYIVSHGWTHPLLDKIEVVKEENISRLE